MGLGQASLHWLARDLEISIGLQEYYILLFSFFFILIFPMSHYSKLVNLSRYVLGRGDRQLASSYSSTSMSSSSVIRYNRNRAKY
jgi:hypothetical protein